jgi:hypothetical protein
MGQNDRRQCVTCTTQLWTKFQRLGLFNIIKEIMETKHLTKTMFERCIHMYTFDVVLSYGKRNYCSDKLKTLTILILYRAVEKNKLFRPSAGRPFAGK